MKAILLSAVYLLVLFLVSRFIFEPTYLYYELWWLDIPMHLLGGFGIGLLLLSVARYMYRSYSLVGMYAAFLTVAIGWEVYEYSRGIIVYDDVYEYLDTVKDIVVGSIGFYTAYFFRKK